MEYSAHASLNVFTRWHVLTSRSDSQVNSLQKGGSRLRFSMANDRLLTQCRAVGTARNVVLMQKAIRRKSMRTAEQTGEKQSHSTQRKVSSTALPEFTFLDPSIVDSGFTTLSSHQIHRAPSLLSQVASLSEKDVFGLVLSFCAGVVFSGFAGMIIRKKRGSKAMSVENRQALARLSELETQELRELFGELPSWLVSSDFERGGWLNKVVSAAWPYLDEATSNVIVNALDPILQATMPNFLTSLRFERFSFGRLPAKIEGVKVYESTDEGAVEIDLQVFWAGDPDVVLGVRAAQDTLSVPVSLTEIQCKFTLRLIFAPLIGKFPCFGALTIALTEEPELLFDLRVVGGDITLVPGLAQPLRTYIKALISSYLVWPRCITVPIPGTGYFLPEERQFDYNPGLLHVEIVSHDVFKEDPGEIGLEICWPGSSSDAEERVQALSDGRMMTPEPTSLLVSDPRYQVLKLKWYSREDEEEDGSYSIVSESSILLLDLLGMNNIDAMSVSDIPSTWGPVTVAVELEHVDFETENPEITRSNRFSKLGRRISALFSRNQDGSNNKELGTGVAFDRMQLQPSVTKIVQLTVRYQSIQSSSGNESFRRENPQEDTLDIQHPS